MTAGMTTTRLPAADFGGPNRYPPPGLTGRPARDYGSEGKRSCNAGLAPRTPVYGSGRPAFSPPTVLRGRGRIFPAPARGNPHPRMAGSM